MVSSKKYHFMRFVQVITKVPLYILCIVLVPFTKLYELFVGCISRIDDWWWV